jgi:hypothetical protein
VVKARVDRSDRHVPHRSDPLAGLTFDLEQDERRALFERQVLEHGLHAMERPTRIEHVPRASRVIGQRLDRRRGLWPSGVCPTARDHHAKRERREPGARRRGAGLVPAFSVGDDEDVLDMVVEVGFRRAHVAQKRRDEGRVGTEQGLGVDRTSVHLGRLGRYGHLCLHAPLCLVGGHPSIERHHQIEAGGTP